MYQSLGRDHGKVQSLLSSLGLGGVAASNNWAISKSRTNGNASILAQRHPPPAVHALHVEHDPRQVRRLSMSQA
ncbi:MAG: hypothetical protein MZV70_57170 [Desulfobacterales bacterium]|nr:hypothetical protein [Desulfobacterales bacterium]